MSTSTPRAGYADPALVARGCLRKTPTKQDTIFGGDDVAPWWIPECPWCGEPVPDDKSVTTVDAYGFALFWFHPGCKESATQWCSDPYQRPAWAARQMAKLLAGEKRTP